MRIAVWHNLPSGGGKRQLYYHVRGLVERGHHVEAWCPSTADQKYLPLGELITEHVLPFEWHPSRSRNPLARFTRVYRDLLRQIEAMDRHCMHCAEEIHRGDFDLLFANACMFFRTTSIGRHVQLPSTIYLGEPYRWLYEALPRLPWLALPRSERRTSPMSAVRFAHNLLKVQGLRVQAREEVANAEAFNTILVNSLFTRESVLRAYGLDARVCYLGIDPEIFHDRRQPREDFVLGVGAFVPTKNIEFIVYALSQVRPPRPRLVWVGNVAIPGYLEELMKFARSVEVEIEPKIGITDAELVDLLNSASMMLYAPRLEPFGFAPLEASACATPIVAVAEGGVRETVADGVNGMLVEYDAAQFADAIERLRNDARYARQLGENGRTLVAEKWSLASAIDRLEGRLLELSGQRAELARSR